MEWYFIMVLIYIFLMDNDVEHLFVFIDCLHIFSGKMSIKSFVYFFMWTVFFVVEL